MNALRALGLVVLVLCTSCASTRYTVTDRTSGKVVQQVKTDAPAGETAVVIVYYGASGPPVMKASVDSEAVVSATVSAARRALLAAGVHP
jgi:hypothetical protein